MLLGGCELSNTLRYSPVIAALLRYGINCKDHRLRNQDKWLRLVRQFKLNLEIIRRVVDGDPKI